MSRLVPYLWGKVPAATQGRSSKPGDKNSLLWFLRKTARCPTCWWWRATTRPRWARCTPGRRWTPSPSSRRRRTERKSRTRRGTEEALHLTNRSRESHAPPTVNTCFSKILHHQWVYQHVCVHRLNKGNIQKKKKEIKTRTCPPWEEEPNIWA